MNAVTIAAIATAAVSVLGAIGALVRDFQTRNTVNDHIASHNEDKPAQ